MYSVLPGVLIGQVSELQGASFSEQGCPVRILWLDYGVGNGRGDYERSVHGPGNREEGVARWFDRCRERRVLPMGTVHTDIDDVPKA